jgi:hypothetical protein
MARQQGTLSLSANFELNNSAPLDARALVPTKNDLYITTNWIALDGNVYTYNGMTVTVAEDLTPANNGIYVLLDSSDITDPANWLFVGSGGASTSWWELAGDAGAPSQIQLGDTALIKGGVGLTSTTSLNEVTLDLDNTGVVPGTYLNNPLSINAQGQIIQVWPGVASVVSVTVGNGLVLSGTSVDPIIDIDYISVNNIILSASTIKWPSIPDAQIIYNDNLTNIVHRAPIDAFISPGRPQAIFSIYNSAVVNEVYNELGTISITQTPGVFNKYIVSFSGTILNSPNYLVNIIRENQQGDLEFVYVSSKTATGFEIKADSQNQINFSLLNVVIY